MLSTFQPGPIPARVATTRGPGSWKPFGTPTTMRRGVLSGTLAQGGASQYANQCSAAELLP